MNDRKERPQANEIINPRKTMERREREAGSAAPAPAPRAAPAMSQSEFSKSDGKRPTPVPPASMVKRYAKGGHVKRSASHPSGKTHRSK